MPDSPPQPSASGDARARRQLMELTIQQFAGGVALAIAAVGFARGGRDTVLGAALIFLAIIFALRAWGLAQHVREIDQEHEQAERDRLQTMLEPRLGPASTAPRPHRPRLFRIWSQ